SYYACHIACTTHGLYLQSFVTRFAFPRTLCCYDRALLLCCCYRAWLLVRTAVTLRFQSCGCSRSRHVFRRNPWSYDVLAVISCCYSSWPLTCTPTTLRVQNCECSVDKTTHKKSEKWWMRRAIVNELCSGETFRATTVVPYYVVGTEHGSEWLPPPPPRSTAVDAADLDMCSGETLGATMFSL